MPDYGKESDCVMHISEVLLHLKNYMDENVVAYTDAMLVYTTIMYGVVAKFAVECEHGEDGLCHVQARQPCGGVSDIFEVIERAMEALDLEMDMDLPAYEYPSTYDI